MKSIIVEKVIVTAAGRHELFAVATSERLPQSVCYSLTFESYLTKWTSRADAENLQADLDLESAHRRHNQQRQEAVNMKRQEETGGLTFDGEASF